MVHSGHMFAINSATGNPYTVSSGSQVNGQETSSMASSPADKLDRALSDRAAFPALRKAAHECTVQLILAYRKAVQTLMEVLIQGSFFGQFLSELSKFLEFFKIRFWENQLRVLEKLWTKISSHHRGLDNLK